MKNKIDFILKRVLIVITAVGISYYLYAQGVVISTSGAATPDASSMLDIQSTSAGILIPRMNETEKGNITTPATGLLIYQTDGTEGFYYYDGSAWLTFLNNAAGGDYNHYFGAEMEYTESDAASSTSTTSSWINKIDWTTSTLSAGDYMVEWSYNQKWTSGSVSTWPKSQITIDATTYYESSMGYNMNAYQGHSGQKKITLASDATVDINLQHRARCSGSCGNSYIQNARIVIYRIE